MIYETLPRIGGYYQEGYAETVTEFVHLWGRDVVVESPILVPCHKYRRRVPIPTLHDCVHNPHNEVLTACYVVWRMLATLVTLRCDECDMRQISLGYVDEELPVISKMLPHRCIRLELRE